MKILTIIATAVFALPLFCQAETGTETNQNKLTQNTITEKQDITEGMVKKVDVENGKITIKHNFFKNLDMPAMTMVFKTSESEMLKKLKIDDKITFKALSLNGKFTASEITPTP